MKYKSSNQFKDLVTEAVSPLQLLKNYAEDLDYKMRGNDLESFNYGTAGTPYFDTEQEAKLYLDLLKKTIAKMERDDMLRVFDCLHHAAKCFTSNENVYDDVSGISASWDEVKKLREYIRLAK